MKRFLIAALSCGTCLVATAPAMAGSSNATINATGTMPATCEVGGAEINLTGAAGSSSMSGEGKAEVSTNGKSLISLSKLDLAAPTDGIYASIVLSSGVGKFSISQNTTGESSNATSRIETPLLDKPYVTATINTTDKSVPLPAGFYNVTSTLTCLSDSQPETPAAPVQPAAQALPAATPKF